MKSGELRTAAKQNPAGVQCENQDVPDPFITLDGNWIRNPFRQGLFYIPLEILLDFKSNSNPFHVSFRGNVYF